MNGTPYCGVEKEPFPLVLAHCCMTGPEAITYIVLIGGVYNSLRKVVTPSKYVPYVGKLLGPRVLVQMRNLQSFVILAK